MEGKENTLTISSWDLEICFRNQAVDTGILEENDSNDEIIMIYIPHFGMATSQICRNLQTLAEESLWGTDPFCRTSVGSLSEKMCNEIHCKINEPHNLINTFA